jgi:5'-nucleotidase
MDSVLSDFDQEVQNRLTERHPDIPLVPRANFRISEDYPAHTQMVRAMSNEPGFFASLPLVDHALEGWQRMLSAGYHPRICSSPLSTNPHCEEEKMGWLETHLVPVFGRLVVDQAIITKNKEKYDAIALVDDRPEIENAGRATWQHIIFDQPYNVRSPQPRLYGWRDSNLLGLLRAAEIQYRQR